MLSNLLRQLTSSFGIFFRTIRAFFTRKLVGVGAYLRRVTNFSRQATKVASASLQGAAAAVKKPTRREDYIETKRLFISKSFLILLAIGLVVLGLLIHFVIWPFLLRTFFTARFWQEDKRLPDWSGKVIVYYDEKKTVPMYSGTLEDGVLQGRGAEYDENGLLTYEGGFVDGLYSGNGSRYDGGVLIYQGAFADGAANGLGTAYAEGKLCYEGAFVNDLYEGTGTAYYPDGGKAYVGGFSAGLYEGEGTAYNQDGSAHYKGGFSQGLFDGEGTLYPGGDDQIKAEFSAGVTNGSIQWFKGGKLWYEGGADDVTPEGFGTLYAGNGNVIYAGEFDQGTLDGEWLLGLTAGELRETFGAASLSETDQADGFVIFNKELGLTALCSYQQGETETQAYRLWLAPEEGTAAAALLPWGSLADARKWAAADRDPAPELTTQVGPISQADGTVGGDWHQSCYRYEGYACMLLSQEERAAPTALCWSRDMEDLPGGGDGQTVDPAVSQSQERLEELLAALEKMDGAGSGGSVVLGNAERLLGLMLTAEDGQSLVDGLIRYYTYGQMAEALALNRPMLEQELADTQTQLQRGSGSQEAVDSVQETLDSLDRQLTQYETARQQALITIQKLCKLSPDEYDLASLLLRFDPVGLDASALGRAAAEYAVAVAAGRYEVDTDGLNRQVRSAVLDLGMAYEGILSAQKTLNQAAAGVSAQTQAYAKGTADRASLYAAQRAQNEAVASLYQAAGEFARQANSLNALSGGWVAEQYGWMPDTFAALFKSEILRGQEAAQAAEDDRASREEEAAGAIEEEKNPPASASPEPSAPPEPGETRPDEGNTPS